jgi:hypothetical protein
VSLSLTTNRIGSDRIGGLGVIGASYIIGGYYIAARVARMLASSYSRRILFSLKLSSIIDG